MSQQELLKKVISFLNENKIEYMVTGSIVSSLQGEPRLTHDIDIVIRITDLNTKKIIEAFPSPDYYISEQGIERAILHHKMFNLIDVQNGDKVDFWIQCNTPFDHARFSRKIFQEVMGIGMYISTPEDTILAKLKWLKLSNGSEKHLIDALRIYEVHYPNINIKYIEKWVKHLKIKKYWERLKKEAEII
jgi:hypothetical protein